jgi:hypothetical protein
MAVTVEEHPESRRYGTDGSVELRWTVRGTSSHSTAKAAAEAEAPSSYDSRDLDGYVSCEPVGDSIDETNDTGIWDARARYVPASLVKFEPRPANTITITGTIGGGSQRVRVGRDTRSAYGTGPDGSTAATVNDHKDLIGVKRGSDGGWEVEGVDIPAGGFDFSVTKVFASGGLPSLGAIDALASPPHVNAAQFSVTDTDTGLSITLAAGECLFLGADFGPSRSDGAVEFTYRFRAAPNKTGQTVAGFSSVAYNGHDYLWTREAGPDADGLIKPEALYVAVLYDAGDFTGLGL